MTPRSSGRRIKEMRKQRGWSRPTAARAVNITIEGLRLIEDGITARPQAATRERLKLVFGADVFSESNRGAHVTG